MMVGRVLKTFFQVDRLRCLHECHEDEQCLAYNFAPSSEGKGRCELNKCGVKDDREREKSLIYTRGVFFHQIRPSKAIVQVASKFTRLFMVSAPNKKINEYMWVTSPDVEVALIHTGIFFHQIRPSNDVWQSKICCIHLTSVFHKLLCLIF